MLRVLTQTPHPPRAHLTHHGRWQAKQAVGGVQLVRLSFPVTCDTAAVSEIVADAIAAVYA